MEIFDHDTDVPLKLWSRSVITIHVDVSTLRIWVAVIPSDWPSSMWVGIIQIFVDLCHFLGESCWGGISDLHILVETKFFPPSEELVHDLIVNFGVDEGHIATKRSENLICSLVVEVLAHLLVEGFDDFVKLESWVVFFEDHGDIKEIVRVCPETLWPAVGTER